MEILILHFIHQIHQPEIILHYLVGVSQVSAEKFIVAEILLFYFLDYLKKLLTKTILCFCHFANPFEVVLSEAELVIVGILLVRKDAVILFILFF
jgi:hypothetical protein